MPGAGKNRMPFTHAGADSATITATPASGGDYRFAIDAAGLALEPKKGDELPPMAIEAELTALDFGGTLGTDPGRTLAAWLAGGGELEIDRLTVTMGEHHRRGDRPSQDLAGGFALRRCARSASSGSTSIPALAERLGLGSQDRLQNIIGMAESGDAPGGRQPGGARPAGDDPRRRARIGFIPIGTIPAPQALTATPPSALPCGRPKSGAAVSCPASMMPRRMARVRVKRSKSSSPSP